MANYKPYTDIKISKNYGPSARQAIARDIVDFIIKRSLSGKDVNGKKFPAYSKSYTRSLDFKNAGKSKSNVNLRLSFDMLNSLHLRSSSAGNLRIGVDKENAKKAEGNELGTYGKKTPIRGKKREFIGISRKDLQIILAKYPLKDRTKLLAAVVESQQKQLEAEQIANNETDIERD